MKHGSKTDDGWEVVLVSGGVQLHRLMNLTDLGVKQYRVVFNGDLVMATVSKHDALVEYHKLQDEQKGVE